MGRTDFLKRTLTGTIVTEESALHIHTIGVVHLTGVDLLTETVGKGDLRCQVIQDLLNK